MKCYAHIDDRPTCISLTEFISNGWLDRVETPEEADLIIVWWWDGFMLNTIREFHHYNKPFLWLNCGTLWFLLNSFDDTVSAQSFTRDGLHKVAVHPVKVNLTMLDGTRQEWLFFNDCVIWWSVLDYVSFTVDHPNKKVEAKGTWLVVNSMLWSTWYALNLGQPIIPVSSDLWGVVWIASAPFQYGFVEPQNMKITRSSRNPVLVWLDWYNWKYENVAHIELSPSEKTVELVFFNHTPFEEKRLLLAEEKMGR